MNRSYTKGKRAEREAETRQRIVEAALALHGEVGPNRTTISMIAERAGVQRHTVYAHLPDERAVFMACSGLFDEREPMPSAERWTGLNDPEARLRTALLGLYAWFDRNAEVTGHVLRDAEHNSTLREVSDLRFGVPLGTMFAALADGLTERQRAALALAMSYYTWRTLMRQAELPLEAAVELMVGSVLGADR
ncbi:MAG TPA: helix-turn-helix domain-containing protein [Devosia sp.]|jgi:AcrR family transcriptional regulator|uniref:TetR/AcrR family transcriptional regulator n=1 Tax=Devosia sp. TaxID=1871048 RepID=UPI002DDD0ABC|nr:helix-turn-helix domain-containing protein [Devosia sp.]HEV2515082.1 helix-turn-helix domain-containing protein [Devosia sp.]